MPDETGDPKAARQSYLRRPLRSSDLLAANVYLFLQNVIYPPLIYVIGRGNLALKFSTPGTRPNINGIVKG
jgi:hypothetical protein